jgi:hypothetical protein
MFRFSCICIVLIFSALLFYSCSKKTTATKTDPPSGNSHPKQAQAPCIFYKTKADYSKNVPVMLTADKSAVASYPDIKDVYADGKPAYPTPLKNGYLLDNRGIGPDVAFLKTSYEEYHALGKTPSATELFQLILEKDPLVEMYQCGTRSQYADPAEAMNSIISSGKMENCKKLK